MARNENDARWQGLGTIIVRAPGKRYKVGTIAALARRVCGLFARPGEKALAKTKALRVAFELAAKQINETGEQNTMETIKDANGNEAFVRIGSVVYISAAHVAATTVDIGRSGESATAKGMGYGSKSNAFSAHSWGADSRGEFALSEWDNRAPATTMYSTNLPTAQALLRGAASVGTLTYDLKIDATSAIEVLEYLKGQLAETKLAVDLEAGARNVFADNIEKEILRILKKELRQGGILWESGTMTNVTLQGAQITPSVKSLDDLADEYMAPYIKEGTLTDCVVRKAYRVANLRLSLRAQYAKGEE